MSMDKILKASFGETSSDISVTFKKTIRLREYETEVIEAETTLKIEGEISGAERVLITGVLRAQLEYEAYCGLCYKGIIDQEELARRRQNLVEEVEALKTKAEAVTGKPMDKYL